MKTFAEFLSASRKNAGISQQELAQKIGVSRISIGNYEIGTQVPSLKTAIVISRLLGFSLDEVAPDGFSHDVIKDRKINAKISDLEKQLNALRLKSIDMLHAKKKTVI